MAETSDNTNTCVSFRLQLIFCKSAMFVNHWKQPGLAPRERRTGSGKAVSTAAGRGPDRDQQGEDTSRGRPEGPQGSGGAQTVRRRRFRAFLTGAWVVKRTNDKHPAPRSGTYRTLLPC